MIEENYREIKKHENILEKNKNWSWKKYEPKQGLNSDLRTRKTHAIPTELIVYIVYIWYRIYIIVNTIVYIWLHCIALHCIALQYFRKNGGRIVVKDMFNAFFPALEREKHTNMELEKQRLSAEQENARQRERSRQIEREKNMITRELNQRENENEYLVC